MGSIDPNVFCDSLNPNTAIRAEIKEMTVLILWKLETPKYISTVDESYPYCLERRWLSGLDPQYVCIKGNEYHYYSEDEIIELGDTSLFSL